MIFILNEEVPSSLLSPSSRYHLFRRSKRQENKHQLLISTHAVHHLKHLPVKCWRGILLWDKACIYHFRFEMVFWLFGSFVFLKNDLNSFIELMCPLRDQEEGFLSSSLASLSLSCSYSGVSCFCLLLSQVFFIFQSSCHSLHFNS